jgi:multidrug efflux pump subunit AcrB
VAEITYEEPPLVYGRHLDGDFAVALEIFKESTANTVEVVQAATAVIENDIGNDPLLQGVRLFVWEDQAEAITNGINGLTKAGLAGSLLALFCLWFFLRRLDSTLIVSMSIPFSILAACGVMYFLGKTLNILSMMGLILGVGMLVDNAVVVLESIDRKHRTEADPKQAALLGAREVGVAVAASTLTSLIVFLPLIVGAKSQLTTWLGEVGITISIAFACSLVSSLTLIPLASAHLLRDKKTRPNRSITWLEDALPAAPRLDLAPPRLDRRGTGRHPARRHRAFAAGLVDMSVFSGTVNSRLHLRYDFQDFAYKSKTRRRCSRSRSTSRRGGTTTASNRSTASSPRTRRRRR